MFNVMLRYASKCMFVGQCCQVAQNTQNRPYKYHYAAVNFKLEVLVNGQ